MKKIAFTFLIALILIGCSTNEETEQQLNRLIQHNEELQKQLEERPNLSSMQLRETLNLSFKIMHAMNNSDFKYLETVVDADVTIDYENKAFIFQNRHIQNFSHIDFSLLEYRAQFLQNDIITVAFAAVSPQSNVEMYFEFVQINEGYLLTSYITN